HHTRRSGQGRVRASQWHRRQRLQVANRGREGQLRRRNRPQGPQRGERTDALARRSAPPSSTGRGEWMASSSKRKTTMAKLNRENAVRERRLRKAAKKNARKQAAADPTSGLNDAPSGVSDVPTADDR